MADGVEGRGEVHIEDVKVLMYLSSIFNDSNEAL